MTSSAILHVKYESPSEVNKRYSYSGKSRLILTSSQKKKTSLDSKMKIIGLILALIEGNSSKQSDQKRELQYDFDDLVSISCVASGFKVSFIEFTSLNVFTKDPLVLS